MASIALGCGSSRDDRGPSSGFDPDAGATDGSGTDSAPAEGGDDSGVLFDTPNGSGAADDGGETEGCKKVDFLFVIDNSGSMDDDQANLIANFPGFIGAIEDTLEIEDFHIMVADSDAGGSPANHPECPGWWEENDPWHIMPCPFPPVPAGAPEDMIELLDDCDRTPGAGIDMPLGFEASNAECTFHDELRYMTADEPDLDAAFACAAQVGIGGNNTERVAAGLIAAVSPELNDAGGCNAGFLRPDALLVVTLLTDEADVASEPKKDPLQWAQALIDAKAGNEKSVVVLGLLDDVPWEDHLENMIAQFSHGAVGSVLSPDYRPFFEQVIPEIDGACDGFMPEG